MFLTVPIKIFKNGKVLFEAKGIQEAARILAEQLNMTIYKCYDPIERGYVYHIPYYVGDDEYRFKAPEGLAANRRKELEETNHKNARRIWLVPANPEVFDIEKAFNLYDTIDWVRSYRYENGDILFLYVTGDVKKVMYKVEVINGIVNSSNVQFNEELWLDKDKLEQAKGKNWSRIRLIDAVDTDALSLKKLREHGLRGNPQSSRKLQDELREYIMSHFESDFSYELFPDEDVEELIEGDKRTVTVNVYERNPLARRKCIEHYGAYCQVCDIDFEKIYGEVGRGFIHVHHIKPLHEIKQGYKVHPIHDLIPVCPNCHAMLHRKENGVYLTFEQLRERVKGRYQNNLVRN